MKKVLLTSLVMLLSLCLFAGGSGESTSSGGSAENPVTITFMHDWPEYQQQFEQIVADFEAANPDIKVETTVITWDILTRTLQTSFASGDAYDVAACWLDRVGGFNALGACYDLTDAMMENDGEWADEFVGPSLELGTVNGHIYGVPFRSTCTILVYNKTMMDEHGWQVPTTLEEFEALMEEIVSTTDGITPLITPGNPQAFQIASLTKTLAEHELYKSGKLLDEEYLSGRMSDVGDEYAKAAAKLRQWAQKGYIGADSMALTGTEATAQFFTGKGVFFFANNNELSALQTNAADAGIEIAFMPFPAPEGVPTLLYNYGVDGWMVYSGTKHPEEAIRFLKYLSSYDVQQKFGNETLSVMGNRNCTYDNEYLNQFVEIFTSGESHRIKFDYNQRILITDEALAIGDFFVNPAATPEDLGQAIVTLKENCINENAV